jgi:HD-GYP domain-containing protein (c-di-GMP phosphodiesterase class II)
MSKISFLDIFNIKQTILHNIDKELAIHGEEVTYITYKLAKKLGYSERYTKKLAILGAIHDIGAYKTEDENIIRGYEILNTQDHSAYGYAIANNIEAISDLSSIILYHHHYYKDINKHIENIKVNEDAFLVSIADKVSLSCNLHNYNKDRIIKDLKCISNRQFKEEHINALHKLIKDDNLIDDIIDKNYKIHIQKLFKDIELEEKYIKTYIVFLPLTINFYSFSTSLHIVSVRSVAEKICDILNIDKSYKLDISHGASFHDIGKVCVPIEILSKKGKLTYEEFKVIKKHVIDTELILKKSFIHKDIIKIASNHHEKLNGCGYPKGLDSNDLSTGDRIVAVADIFCALTEKRYYKDKLGKKDTISILKNMADNNEIDNDLVNLVIKKFEEILNYKESEVKKYYNLISNIEKDFKNVAYKLKKL